MEIRVRKEGGVCSPDPKYQGREGDPPTPVVRGQATRGRAHSRRPGCQVSAAPGAWDGSQPLLQEAGCWVLWSFPETADRP